MTSEELFTALRSRFIEVLKANDIEKEPVQVTCRSLSPEEAIGTPGRQDFPILTGKDVMIQAEFRGCRGQAFTDAPASFRGLFPKSWRWISYTMPTPGASLSR